MMYYTDLPDEAPRIRPHPGWFSDVTGDVLSENELLNHGFLPIRNEPPEFDARYQRVETLPMEKWRVNEKSVTMLFKVVDLPLIDVIQKRVEEVRALSDSTLASGFPEPTTGLHISYDDSTRTDMAGLTSQAILGMLGAPWGDGSKRGFISMTNERVPLPTPETARDFVAAYGDYYTHVKQHARDLKDALLEMESVEETLAFDITEGWSPPDLPGDEPQPGSPL